MRRPERSGRERSRGIMIVAGCLAVSLAILLIVPNWIFGYTNISSNALIFLIIELAFVFILYAVLKKLAELVFKRRKTN